MKLNVVKNLIQIMILFLISISFGCQKNSTVFETPIKIVDQQFTIPENSPAGTVVGQIEVKNTTSTLLNYYLLSGDYSNAFMLETKTGRLILKDSSLINFEEIKQINLEVMVGYENISKNYGVFANVILNIEDKPDAYLWVNDGASGKNQVAVVNSLQSGSNPTMANYLFASAWTNNLKPNVTRSYLQFDLTAIPPEAQIVRATLSLYNPKDTIKEHQQSCFSGSNAFCLRQVTSLWDWQTITWNNQPTFSSLLQVNIPACSSAQQDCEKIDISEMVKYIVKFPAKNHGFVMMLENENYYRRLCFASPNYPDENLRPKVEINYLE
jgi:hypothetical protein